MLAKRKPRSSAAPSSTAQRLRQSQRRPAARADGARRQCRLGSDHALVRHRRPGAGNALLACSATRKLRLNPRVMPPEPAVEMATVNGARRRGWASGSARSKWARKPTSCCSTRRPEWLPLYNPVSNLVYSATGNTVSDVFVAGEQVVRDGHADEDRREQALRADPRCGVALQQAPEDRPDGAAEMAGDVTWTPPTQKHATAAKTRRRDRRADVPVRRLPAAGEAIEVADGIFWVSTPVPFVGLKQVNLWLLRDGDGWTMVDCSYGAAMQRELIETVGPSCWADGRSQQLIVTHFHPTTPVAPAGSRRSGACARGCRTANGSPRISR